LGGKNIEQTPEEAKPLKVFKVFEVNPFAWFIPFCGVDVDDVSTISPDEKIHKLIEMDRYLLWVRCATSNTAEQPNIHPARTKVS
jgi:hypothetical protein